MLGLLTIVLPILLLAVPVAEMLSGEKKTPKKRIFTVATFLLGVGILIVNIVQSRKSDREKADMLLDDTQGSKMCPTLLPVQNAVPSNFIPLLLQNPDSHLNLLDVRFEIHQNHNLIPGGSFEGHAEGKTTNLNLFPNEGVLSGAALTSPFLPNMPVEIRLWTRRTECTESFDMHLRPVKPGEESIKVWQYSNVRKVDANGHELLTPDLARLATTRSK